MDTASSDDVIKRYYRERAPVYDRVYMYPERRGDLRYLERHIPNQFAGRDVLEVAAGTGYWTQFICRKANSILATDAIVESLAQIKQRGVTDTVSTQIVDAYSLDELHEIYTGAFAGLWFSHVPVERRREWLVSLHRRLDPRQVDRVEERRERHVRRQPGGLPRPGQERSSYSWTIHRPSAKEFRCRTRTSVATPTRIV